ncbi:amphibian RCA protein 2 isoform X1 [Xenopus tropicalis]|uniref:ARC2 n=2 Tax=Xenopus tropicalis TaxID=8364 RepID=C4B802_XENTR|nr:amphibian RCA protein 2 precursor [Xenopus tropicalis]XP_012820199.1 amphibian RCA protein 2 isoform X1 [Xenopus tropicalis]XP_031751955.1 amphibian RCA protein 2 isoform X1 [Xenopus tropicalis]BAH58779.1 ARC2 [Xenopus tropicalis]|eukprot:XP_012820199.1 PREDICTED: amphibian RCA protein 2 isoform X1 [Xenopus tropicalis]
MFPYCSIRHVTALFLLYLVSSLAGVEGACDPPPRLSYADAKLDSVNTYENGSKINYDCLPGYRSIPGTIRYVTCLGSTWSNPPTFCEVVKCRNPGEIQNGQIEEPINQSFGSRVVFKCNTGYRMLSKLNYRDCQSNGEWSNDVPKCEAQVCPPPTAITDGDFSPQKDEYSYQDSVTFKCNKDLALVGSTSLFCTAHGNWSSDEPNCKDVVCEYPHVENGQKISGLRGPYKLNYAVTFKCDNGFELTGPQTITCTVDNIWEPPLPECRRKDKEGTENAEKPGNVGVIVGAIFGVLAVGAAVGGSVYYFIIKKRKPKTDSPRAHYSNVSN